MGASTDRGWLSAIPGLFSAMMFGALLPACASDSSPSADSGVPADTAAVCPPRDPDVWLVHSVTLSGVDGQDWPDAEVTAEPCTVALATQQQDTLRVELACGPGTAVLELQTPALLSGQPRIASGQQVSLSVWPTGNPTVYGWRIDDENSSPLLAVAERVHQIASAFSTVQVKAEFDADACRLPQDGLLADRAAIEVQVVTTATVSLVPDGRSQRFRGPYGDFLMLVPTLGRNPACLHDCGDIWLNVLLGLVALDDM